MRVFVQSRQRFVREALAAFLVEHAQFEVVGMAALIEALPYLEGATVDAAVVFPEMAGGWEEAVAAIRSRHPGIRIVVLSTEAMAASTAIALDKGAFVDPDLGVNAVLAALGVAVERASPRTDLPGSRMADGPRLTRREREVLNEIRAGTSMQEIAAHLGISRTTVDKHKRNAFEKLGVQSQAHAVVVALRHGLLPLRLPTAATETTKQ